jgi:hypothetical protein
MRFGGGHHHHHQGRKYSRTNHTDIRKHLVMHMSLYFASSFTAELFMSHLARMHWRGRLYRRVWRSRYGVHTPALIDSCALTSCAHCSTQSCSFARYSICSSFSNCKVFCLTRKIAESPWCLQVHNHARYSKHAWHMLTRGC